MNVLFVNYGDFTTNSLNHIGAFANALCAAGHPCAVAVPSGRETLGIVREPLFIPVTYAGALERPRLFPDGRGADLVHAWTPRENVRRFVLGYQARAPARLLVHLEDNETRLLEVYTDRSLEDLRALDAEEAGRLLSDALSHPLRLQNLLRLADGVTTIIERLQETVPPGPEVRMLFPGVDFSLYHPRAADPELRRELGLAGGEKVIAFTGSTTFANEAEMRELYLAVALLNRGGIPVRLVRTGITSPQFRASLPEAVQAHVTDLGLIEKDRLPGLLALSDVLVQPGRPGPFNDFRLPSKLPEFLASGRPVILPATNIGLMVEDGVEAIVLQDGSPEAIAAACRRVFGDAALAARLGENGAAFARRHFDLEANTRALLGFYEEIVGRTSRAPWKIPPAGRSGDLALLLEQALSGAPDGAFADDLVRQARLLEETVAGLTAREREWKKAAEEASLTRQHAANLEASLGEARRDAELGRRHAANLEGWVKDARRDAELAQQHAANLQAELAGVREQAAAARGRLESDLAGARTHAANLGRQLGEIRTHAEGLDAAFARAESARAAAVERIAELERRLQAEGQRHVAEAARAAAEREALDATIRLRDDKIRRMQQSASWRLTAPLRAIRRAFFDRNHPPGNPAAPAGVDPTAASDRAGPPEEAPLFAVDTPRTWENLPVWRFTVRGWILPRDGGAVSGVRARVGETVFEGRSGLRRVDVRAAVPGHHHAMDSGFAIEVTVPPPGGRLALEAERPGGRWTTFFETAVSLAPDATDRALDPYQRWMRNSEDLSPAALGRRREEAESWEEPPLFSVVMPVYNTPEKWLERAVASVRAQTWPRWELCIADDASTEPHVRPALERLAAGDERVKVVFRAANGHISASSNSALALATGAWVALLDHDDELAPHALHEVATLLRREPETDLVYSDEDKIDEQGRRGTPYFKPDFLPDLFTGQNFVSHLAVYRTSIVREIGGFREGYEGSQDWDLALRFVERTTPERIRHLPHVLYHWRMIRGSTALLLSEKSYPVDAARRALAGHFERMGETAEILPVPGGHWRVKYPVPSPAPLVSLIIPTRNGLPLVRRCVESILERTTYPAFEILIVDNCSDDPETLAWLKAIASADLGGTGSARSADDREVVPPGPTTDAPKSRAPVRVLRDPRPFNFSALNNGAVAQARGEFVALLNNDLEVITPGWLDEMVAQAARPGVGCVGAMLYYPDDTIQHAGVVLGIGGVAGHAFKRFPRGAEGVFNRARLVQNYSAVTAACLVVRKTTYEAVGGLGEKELAVAFNDIDFCLKVRAAGSRNLWTPFAEFYHHESASRGPEDTPEKHARFRREIEVMQERWGETLLNDPAYNPNLTLEHEDFSVAPVSRLASPVPPGALAEARR